MTLQENIAQDPNVAPVQETKPSDKEINFRAFQAKYERQLAEEREAREQERKAREAAERKLQQLSIQDDEEDDDEPYVAKKKLKKELSRFGESQKQYTQSEIKQTVAQALQEERKSMWLNQNPDFYDVMQQHAEKLAIKSPGLAEKILKMPDTFERQQLVYENIKALGLDKPEVKQSSIQEKVDANRRSPYYQPSGMATAPYSQVGDFSEMGQKQSYDRMKELQKRMRI